MNFKIKYIFFIAAVLMSNLVFSQQTPALDQTQPILIMNANAHIGNGQVIENAAVAFENGKLTIVADATRIRIDGSKNYKVIEAGGKHVYPGFIAPNTDLGLIEIGAVRATNDRSEVGLLNPNIRSIIAYNTDSKITPTVRSNGTLLAQIVPQGGRISGSSTVVELDAWNWEDAAYTADRGIHLNWPRLFTWSWRSREVINKNKDYAKQVREVEDFFNEAKAYTQKENVKDSNLKFEAMSGLFDKSKKLFVNTNDAKTITEAVLMAKKYNVEIVIVGGRDSWRVSDLLKKNSVAVILRDVHSLPGRQDEDVDQPFKTPAQLQDAGVLFAFSIGGAWQQRNLPFQAGHAVGYGLSYEDAVSGLTLNTAKILGIDQTVGSLETGKDATLFISEGDPLDMRTNKVTHAFIQGKEIDLDNKQKALYRKYKAKYGQE